MMRKLRFIREIAVLPFREAIRYIYLKISGKEPLVTGSCNYCGDCCRSIHLRYGGWIDLEKKFLQLIDYNPDYRRFNIVSKDDRGYLLFTCSWLKSDNTCKDYQKRLDICRNYPSKSLYLCGGKTLSRCGYSMREVTPFKKYLAHELKKKNEKTGTHS